MVAVRYQPKYAQSKSAVARLNMAPTVRGANPRCHPPFVPAPGADRFEVRVRVELMLDAWRN